MNQTTGHALIIGGGPAGLMAAEMLSAAGARVTVAEAKPTMARKFLMAGKSGLNLTKAEPLGTFEAAYQDAADWLAPMLKDFGPDAVTKWAEGLGQTMFTGSTGRVFPRAMKASPLLRAWLARLSDQGVDLRTRWRWTGWQADTALFETPRGPASIDADVTVLALGGASWPRLGSDGAWAALFQDDVAPFQPANAGLAVNWSPHMARRFGTPIKGTALQAGATVSRGEWTLSERGLEGGGVYMVFRAVREGAGLSVDLLPDLSVDTVAKRLKAPRGKASLSNHLRKRLRLGAEKIALLREFGSLPSAPVALAQRIKHLPITHAGPRPMAEAISTAGGLRREALDETLMLRARPGVFAAGEMLDWEAPTGGYLLTACLATGRWAGLGAAKFLAAKATNR